jgi:hypothetical protein
MRRYKTPTGEFEISRVIWNPWWYPPDAEWAAKDSVTPPGPSNPMGKVKLLLNGPYYLHGTPLVSSLGSAASHGCVRMRSEDAAELARIAQRHGGADVSAEFMDSVMASWKRTRVVDLDAFIPVSIVYRIAEVRDSMLTVYPDVYRRASSGVAAHVVQALLDQGHDSSQIAMAAVRELVRRGRTKAVTVTLEKLLSTPAR